MIQTRIFIKDLDATTTPAQDLNVTKDELIFGQLDACVILEAATAQKNTGVAFYIVTDDGKKIWVETSAKMLDGINSAAKGADARFAAKNK